MQRYLLASSEVVQSIQDDIDIIVTDGRLKHARVHHLLDPIYKKVMRKQNPFEIVFKDISKFDAQNPISLLSEIESGKLTDKFIKRFLNKAPNLKDIDLNQSLQNLKSFNNNLKLANDNDSDDDGLPPPTQLPPAPPPPPSLPAFDFSSIRDVPQMTPDVSRNIFEPKVGTEPFCSNEVKVLLKEEKMLVMRNKLNRLFPEAAKIFQEIPTEAAVKNEIPIPNIQKIARELERAAVPKDVMFFRGGENAQFCKKIEMFGLNYDIEKLLNYLESDECYELLNRNKMSIHIETGNIFFENASSGENILDFIAAQQNYDIKLLQIKFSYSADY